MIKSLIVAFDESLAIGKDNGLLCHLSDDLKNFKKATMGKPIIMGRKTYESIGKLLPGRENIILSRNPEYKVEGALHFTSIDDVIKWGEKNLKEEIVFIGGGHIYNEALPFCNKLYITHIKNTFKEADAYFPKVNLRKYKVIESLYWPCDEKNQYDWQFCIYIK
jgi:dihydrofolate reductase